METAELKAWAQAHAEGPVDDRRDMSLSLTSKLLRFRWNDGFAVAVGSERSLGPVRIDAVLDGLAWYLSRCKGASDPLHIVLGLPQNDADRGGAITEHLGAVGTLVATLRNGPPIRVWTISSAEEPVEQPAAPAVFTTQSPRRWADMLMAAAAAPVKGMAGEVVKAVDHPAFALYPKLSSLKSPEPWQMRLDGLEIGRAGAQSTTLRLASRDIGAPGEPRDTWRRVVGMHPVPFDANALPRLVELIRRLIGAWSKSGVNGCLDHGHPEHALEAHLLSGRLQIVTPEGPLGLAVPFRSGMLGAAQFPTLWGDVTRPSRYLDALLRDGAGHPWAVELKDQDAGGGHGAYLRHGIGQAVLYRHYIRSVDALDPWFSGFGLDRTSCRAALAFPTAAQASAKSIEMHLDLAERFDVAVLQFRRPGAPAE